MPDYTVTVRTTVTANCSEHGDFATIDTPGARNEEDDTRYLKEMQEVLKKHYEEGHKEKQHE